MTLHESIDIKYISLKSQNHDFFDFFRVILINDFNQMILIKQPWTTKKLQNRNNGGKY